MKVLGNLYAIDLPQKFLMRFSKYLILLTFLTAFFSCKKDSDKVDTTPNFYFVNGGTDNFANNLILFPSADTITYNMVISSTYLTAKPVTITVSVQDSARQSYNEAYSTSYQLMPSTAYSFQTTITASTESVYDTIPLKLNKQFLANGEYMLPVVITSISDYKLDTAFRILYLHTSGNLLAGIYASTIFKTMYNGDAGNNDVNDTASFAITKNMVPLTVAESQLDYAELGPNGWKYILTYEGQTLNVQVNDVMLNSIQAGSFKVIQSNFDAITKDIYIKSSYKNLSGDERIVEESLTLQK